jgi:hypothetical protein
VEGYDEPEILPSSLSQFCLTGADAGHINPKESGGLGLPLKAVQERMGHASVMMTADVYGHLFPRGDDGKELDSAAALLA